MNTHMKTVIAAAAVVLLWGGAAGAKEAAKSPGEAAGAQQATNAGDGWREAITSAFTVKVPADWVQRQSKLRPTGRGLGRWAYRSPKGGFNLQVNLSRDTGQSKFDQKAKEMVQRAKARYTKVRVVETKPFTVPKKDGGGKNGQRQIHPAIFRGNPVGRAGERRLVFLLFTRAHKSKRFVTLRIAAADRRIDGFVDVAERIADSFELHR